MDEIVKVFANYVSTVDNLQNLKLNKLLPEDADIGEIAYSMCLCYAPDSTIEAFNNVMNIVLKQPEKKKRNISVEEYEAKEQIRKEHRLNAMKFSQNYVKSIE